MMRTSSTLDVVGLAIEDVFADPCGNLVNHFYYLVPCIAAQAGADFANWDCMCWSRGYF